MSLPAPVQHAIAELRRQRGEPLCAYLYDLAALIVEEGMAGTCIRFEIGRFLSAACGYYLMDVLARQQPVAALAVGDLLVFTLAGAYAWNISHQHFLMHEPPQMVFLES